MTWTAVNHIELILSWWHVLCARCHAVPLISIRGAVTIGRQIIDAAATSKECPLRSWNASFQVPACSCWNWLAEVLLELFTRLNGVHCLERFVIFIIVLVLA